MRHARASGTAILAVALLATACGAPSAQPAPTTTLTVWLMKESAPDNVISELNQQFHTLHPDVQVRLTTLEWPGRDEKWQAGMAAATPPDVLEMGNSDVLAYASTGKLADLTRQDFENSDSWLTGLRDAGSYEGRLYGVPYYGGDRVVIYRKDLWQQAGLGQPPATLAQLEADAAKLTATNKAADFSALYFPGRYQYAALPFVLDAGGTVATQQNGKWTGTLSSPKSQAGLRTWADFVAKVSRAPADKDETTDVDALGSGRAAMIIDQGTTAGAVAKKYPTLGDQLGVFAMPGATGPMPVFLGGSNLVVPKASRQADLAAQWIRLLTGTQYEGLLGQSGLVPNSTGLSALVSGVTAVELAAAAKSWFTPLSTRWSAVDNANVIQDMLQSIADGQAGVAEASAAADTKITQLLNTPG
ncbi:extracellular solute-binding protein [Kutzneria sp. CA-103260]|uniref:extracellular solute-binding protein n=1 Tax=Kutzneria sp. CA-103260 TaxID=2802641 RepID=UPI001BA8D58A|nr:extracellular solute-binding protein [Kutzneria sp. CA-103260]QUQ62462.1 sugar ABC transporter periplasmic protein [Kutzneria sp. CA-103260]